jgi:hypothetical protein
LLSGQANRIIEPVVLCSTRISHIYWLLFGLAIVDLYITSLDVTHTLSTYRSMILQLFYYISGSLFTFLYALVILNICLQYWKDRRREPENPQANPIPNPIPDPLLISPTFDIRVHLDVPNYGWVVALIIPSTEARRLCLHPQVAAIRDFRSLWVQRPSFHKPWRTACRL